VQREEEKAGEAALDCAHDPLDLGLSGTVLNKLFAQRSSVI
jgi:hypothetical protein